jgi:hypothetical protein
MSDAPATKRELDAGLGELPGELDAGLGELRGEMTAMEARLSQAMSAMEARLFGHFGEAMSAMEARLFRHIGEATSHAVNVVGEQIRTLIVAIDDRYKDLPPTHAKLRADFEAHAGDPRVHVQPDATGPRRARRSRAR